MPKDNGEFYTDDNIIYKTSDTNFLRADREYLLKIINNSSGNIVTSRTKLIDNINVTTSFPSFYRLWSFITEEKFHFDFNQFVTHLLVMLPTYQLQMLVKIQK